MEEEEAVMRRIGVRRVLSLWFGFSACLWWSIIFSLMLLTNKGVYIYEPSLFVLLFESVFFLIGAILIINELIKIYMYKEEKEVL